MDRTSVGFGGRVRSEWHGMGRRVVAHTAVLALLAAGFVGLSVTPASASFSRVQPRRPERAERLGRRQGCRQPGSLHEQQRQQRRRDEHRRVLGDAVVALQRFVQQPRRRHAVHPGRRHGRCAERDRGREPDHPCRQQVGGLVRVQGGRAGRRVEDQRLRGQLRPRRPDGGEPLPPERLAEREPRYHRQPLQLLVHEQPALLRHPAGEPGVGDRGDVAHRRDDDRLPEPDGGRPVDLRIHHLRVRQGHRSTSRPRRCSRGRTRGATATASTTRPAAA